MDPFDIVQDNSNTQLNNSNLVDKPKRNLDPFGVDTRTVSSISPGEVSLSERDVFSDEYQFSPGQDQEDIMARNQSVPELFGKALWNSAVEIGAGAAEGVGYLADVKGIWDSFTQQETEYGNWFSDIAKQAKESMSADIKLTQEAREDFAPTDATWWASNAPSVASAISLAIPAMGAVRGLTAISKIGSLGRVNKLVKSVGTANKIAGTSSAVLSRYMENTMEASETFDSTYNELISQGLSDEDAKAKAGLAARDSWNSNWVNLAFDVVQFNMLGKGVNAANINSKDLAKSLGKSMAGKGAALAGNMVQEGVEEGIQYVVGQEAKRAQTEEGAAYFDKGLFESFSEYIDDPEMKTSMFFGALGGGVFNAGGGAIDAHFKKKSDKLADAYLEKQKALDSNDYTKASDIDTSEFMQTAYAHAETGKMNDFKDKLTVELNKTDAELAAEGKNESQIAEHRKIFQNLVEDADYVGNEFSRIQDVRGKDNKLKQKELFTLYHRRVKERSLADINEKIGKVKAGATLPMMEAIELSSLNVFEAIRINTTNKNQKIDNHERVGEVVKRRKKQLQDSLEASAKAMDLSVDEYIKTLPVAEAELQKMIAQKVSTQMTLESLNGTLKDINDPAKEADVLNNINNTRKEAILATISPEMGIDQLNQFISDPQVSKDVITKVDELTKDANKHIPSGDNVYGQIDRRYNGSNLALSKDLKNIAFLTSDIKNIEDFKTKYSNNNLFKQTVDSYYKSLLKDTASSGVTFGEDVDSNANQPDDEDSFLPSQSKTLTFDVSVVANNDTALVRLSSDNPSIVEVIGYKIDGIDPVKGITRIPLSSAEKLFKLKSINSSRWNILYDIDGRVISSQNNIIELEDGTTIPLMTVEEQQNLDNPDFSFKGKQIRLETVPNAKWGKKKGFDKMLILVKYEHEGQWLTAGMLKSINKNASTPIEQKILDIRQNIFNSQETTFDFDIKIKERTTGNIVKGMDQPVTALLAAGQPLMLGVILPNEDGTYQISYGGSIDIDTSLVEYNPSSMMGYYEGNTVTFIKTPKGTYVPMKLKTAKLSEFPDELNKVYKLIESFKEGDDIVELNSNLQELTFLTLKRLSDNTWSYEFLKNTGEKGYSEPMTQEALFNYIKENKAIRINKDKINNGNYNASVAKFLRSDITLAPLKTRGASLVLSFDKVNLGTTTQPVIQEVKPLELKPVVVNTPLDDTIVATENTQDLLEVFSLPDTTSAVMADVPVKVTEVVATEAPVVSDIEAKKADIERRRQEELLGGFKVEDNRPVKNGSKPQTRIKVNSDGTKITFEGFYADKPDTGLNASYPKMTLEEFRNSEFYKNLKPESREQLEEMISDNEDSVTGIALNEIRISKSEGDFIGKGNSGITITILTKDGNINDIALASNTSKINAKYDAELDALEQSAPTATEVKKDIDPNTGKERIGRFDRTRRNRVANSNVTEVWNKEVEMAWFKKNYPNTPISVLADLSHIAETGGIELWGMYENAAIYMAENAGRGTLYHESFHLVFNSMLTEKERISLLKQAKVKGTALDKEEWFADEFSDYMLNEKLSEGLSDSIKDFFKRLYNIISIVAERLGLKKDATIDEMFYRASKGIYNNFPKFKRDVTMFKKNLYGELNPSEATSAAKIIADSIINEVIPSLREKYNKLDAEDVDILNMSMAKDKKGDADGYSIKGLFKTVYDFLQSDYEELPDGSFDKEVLGRVIKSMLTENADGTITYRALMQLAISKLSSYGLKLNPNGFDTIERTIDETIEETDTDEVGESKVKESYGNSDKFTSAKDNFRGRSLRLMSSIPFANKTFASKQMYHEFSYIYSTLQEELVDSVSIEQMMEKLEDLYSITPEFRMISDEFVKDPTLKTEFWNNFGQRISAPFRTIKKERDGNFHTFETNRVGVKRDIISDWQYFFENNNDLYNETEGVKDIPGIKEDIDFLNNLSKIYNNELKRDDGLDSDDIVRLSEVLFKIGIPFNEPKLRSVLSLNSEESTKSGARLAIDLIKGYDNKGLLFVLNQLANKKSPFVDSIDSVKATQSVASILVKMFPTMRQTSFLNGENKQVNSNVAPRQSFRFVNLLKSSKQRADAILTERMKDPFFSRMPLFKMIKEEDRLRQKMSLEIFDTLKDVKGKGIPYSTLTRRQFDAIRFNMWYNRAKDFTKDGNTIYGKETNDAFYGLPIPSDSTSYTVFKFVKLTHSEARKGIIDAVRQEYDRILDLQNKITPYQKEYDAWRNGTLSNQDLPAALKKIPYSLLANGLNYHIFPALNGQTITDYNLTEKVNPLIDQVIKDEINSLIKEGVIDAAFTNVNGSLDARIFAEKFDTKSLIEQYVLNSMFMNTQLTFMFGNDIAYYKPVVKKVGSNKTKTGEVQTEDFFKRIKQIWSPGTYLDTNAKFIDEAGVTHGVRESYKVAYIEDVEIPSEQIQKIVGLFETETEKAFVRDKYESMNISDAFTIIDPFRYREVMISSAQWSHAHEKQYNHIINGRVVPANELVVFQPIKPFMFENVWVDGKWVPTQHKNAEMLLIPQMAIGNPIFQNALEKMGWVFNADGSYRFDVSKRNVDAILFNSSVKVGEMMTLKSISDIDSSNTQSFNNNNYRIQMGTPEHFMDSNITFGTQYRKLILEGIQMSSIYTFSDGSTKTGAEIFKLYNDAIELNLSEGLSNVEKIFKNADGSINYDSMLNEIRKYVMEKDLGSDYLEALRWLDPNNKRGGTVLPFYHPSISYNLEAILNSFYKNNVTKQEANGMALYNTSSYGYSDTGKLRKPKIVFAEDGKSIKYVEAIIPIQSKELLEEFLGEDGFVDINKVPEALKEGLFYRIPTEDKYSMVHIRVIGYFPSQVGAQIVLPDEITTKAGLDFDIDKMYGFMMNHYKDSKTGKFNKVKSGLESKKARQNLMLDIGIAIMSHKSSAASQMRPGNFDNLKEIRDEIVKAQGKSSVKLNFALPSTHTEVQSRNMTGGKLIGPFANHRVNHVLMGFGNFMIAKDRGIKFNGVEKNNLSTNTSADGKLIGSKLASFVAAVVDNAKDPLASFFNLTMTFSDTVATIVRSGHTERTALRFIAQPVMMEFTSRFSNSDNTGTLNAIALMREMIDEEYALVNDPNMVNQLLQSIELTDDNLLEQIAKENSTEPTTASDKLGIVAYRIKTLGQMVEIMEVADELNKVMSAMRYDSMGKAAGPSYADTLIKVRSYDKLIKKSNLVTGLAEFNEIPWVKSFYEKGVATALERIIEVGNYPYKNEVFSDILTYFEDRKTNGSLTANEINSLIRSIMTALTSMSPIYNAKKSNELLTSFPKRFMQYKKDNPAGAYSNLTNLMSIDKAAKNDGRYSKPYDFLIFNRSGIDSQHMQSLKDTWNEMLNSSKEEERLLANDLAIYAFVTSGFVFSSNALTDLIPVTHSSEMRENINSESVNEFMKKSFFANHSEALLTQIQNQILRNFYQSASYVKEVDITKYKLQKNEGKLFFVVEDYLTESNLVRAFYSAIKDDSGKIVSYEQDFEPIPYFRARADKGSIKSDPILMMPRKDPNSNRVIFMEQEPLGVPNRIVQFDLQNDIVVQVGQSNPFIEDAVYEDVTEVINQPKKITTGEISYLIKLGEIIYLDENKKPCKNWTK